MNKQKNKLSMLTGVALILMCVGLLACVVSVALMGFRFTSIPEQLDARRGDRLLVEYRTEGSDVVSRIEVDTSNVKVVLRESKDRSAGLTYHEDEDTTYRRTLEGGVLRLERDKRFSWNFFSFDFDFDDEVVVFVPQGGSTVDVEVETSNSNIECLEQVAFGDLRLTTSNGRVELKGPSADSFDIKSSNGRLALNELITAGNLIANTSNARIEAANIKARGVELGTSNGQIELDDIDAQAIDLKTSNAKIIGRLPKTEMNYNFDIKTSNSKIILGGQELGNPYSRQNQSATTDFFAKTSNGRIEVAFAEY